MEELKLWTEKARCRDPLKGFGCAAEGRVTLVFVETNFPYG
jgi:hypothetical protein